MAVCLSPPTTPAYPAGASPTTAPVAVTMTVVNPAPSTAEGHRDAEPSAAIPATTSPVPASAVRRGPNLRSATPAPPAPPRPSARSAAAPAGRWRADPALRRPGGGNVAVNSAPNMPAETTSSSPIAAVTAVDRATACGTNGCAARRSRRTNRAARPAAAPNPMTVGAALHPVLGHADQRVHETPRGPSRAGRHRAGPAARRSARPTRRGGPYRERQHADHQRAARLDEEHRPPAQCATSTPPTAARPPRPPRSRWSARPSASPAGRAGTRPQQPERRGLQQRAEHPLGDPQSDHPAHAGREHDARRRRPEADTPMAKAAGARTGPRAARRTPADAPPRADSRCWSTGPGRRSRPQIPLQGGLGDGQHGAVEGDDHGPGHAAARTRSAASYGLRTEVRVESRVDAGVRSRRRAGRRRAPAGGCPSATAGRCRAGSPTTRRRRRRVRRPARAEPDEIDQQREDRQAGLREAQPVACQQIVAEHQLEHARLVQREVDVRPRPSRSRRAAPGPRPPRSRALAEIARSPRRAMADSSSWVGK